MIDLLGATGGLVEFKAALLASHGFAALALAYIDYDDLPAFPPYHEMEYFEDAANWLSSHPKVLPHGIGIHAICYGAMIALLMANLQMKPVKAIAAISPLIHVYPTAFKYKGSFISEVAHFDQSKKSTGARWKHLSLCFSNSHRFKYSSVKVPLPGTS